MSNNNDGCELSLESWCRTKEGEEVKFNFAWTIKNFSTRPENPGESLYSSVFSLQAPDDIKSDWRLQLYPKGEGGEDSDFLTVYADNNSERWVWVKTWFSVLDEAKKKHYRKNGNEGDDWEMQMHNQDLCGITEFLDLDFLHFEASVLLPNDCLTILCEITFLIPDRSAPVSVDEDIKMVQPGQRSLLQDMEIAFSNKELTDVQLLCGDKVYDCHQFMLSARSPVFRAMFQGNMKEKKTMTVIVKDLHPDVLEEVLTFIYTGKCPNVDNLARDLLGAADKYQVEVLKTVCIEKLCNRIDVNNCVDYLVIGDMYQVDLLKKCSLDFIAKYVGSVCDLGGWKEPLLGNPSLMVDVIEAIARKDIRGKVIREEDFH